MVSSLPPNVSRLGVFGGSFDPIHVGHLIAAEILAYRLRLDQVIFLPAAIPPHKLNQTLSPNDDRLRMIEIALDGEDSFSVSQIDLSRPGPSYTVDTLEEIRERVGADVELYFLMGMDSLRDFPGWHQPGRIAKLARLGVARRPGADVSVREIEVLVPESKGRIDVVGVPLIDVSSSDIRDRVRSGQPYKYQVTPAVAAYIQKRRLYRDI